MCSYKPISSMHLYSQILQVASVESFPSLRSEKLQCYSCMIPACMGMSNNDTRNILKPDEEAVQLTLLSKKISLFFYSQIPAKKVKPIR